MAAAVPGYRTLKNGLLGLKDEQRLGRTIQAGNAALSDLTEILVLAVQKHLETVDLESIKSDSVVIAVTDSVGEALIKCANRKRTDRAEVVGTGIHRALAEMLSANDLLRGLDAEVWLGQLLPLEVLSQLISPILLAADVQIDAITRRERAIGELVEWHLPLAKPFARSAMRQPFEFDDMMSESVLILRHVAERFDPDTGSRFSSYAKVALKRDLWRHSPSTIGLTRHSGDQVREVDALENKLSQERGRRVTTEEVYEQLACTDRTRDEIENVRRILKVRRQTHPNSGQPLADLSDLQLPDPFHAASDKEAFERLRVVFRRLSSLERRVVVGHCVLALSFRRLAKRLKKSPKTLQEVYKESLQKLAEYLDPNRPNRKPR
jgi:RNA polymerase sigma factor (sigma-70 family)